MDRETLHPTPPRRPARRASALLLIAVLVLGGAAHLWHHLTDPDCGEGHGPAAHPCVACAALHGAAVVASTITATPPAPFTPSPLFAPAALAPVSATRVCGDPRAPPRG